MDGSARIALKIQPPFQKFIFIEKESEKIRMLMGLKEEFAHRNIELINRDCNEYLQEICLSDWIKERRRAVLFLDPFGMQVRWETIEAIASTRAIDLWILFPLGVAINRLLKRDGEIGDVLRERLNDVFGSSDWYEEFYDVTIQPSLFGPAKKVEKTADLEAVGRYFISRLKTIFSGVVDEPHFLKNSRKNPIYMLCFAAGNERGAPTAIKIARHILEN